MEKGETKSENSQILVLYLNYGNESTINEKDGENRRSVVIEYFIIFYIIHYISHYTNNALFVFKTQKWGTITEQTHFYLWWENIYFSGLYKIIIVLQKLTHTDIILGTGKWHLW